MKEDKPCKGAYKYTPFAKSVLALLTENRRKIFPSTPPLFLRMLCCFCCIIMLYRILFFIIQTFFCKEMALKNN